MPEDGYSVNAKHGGIYNTDINSFVGDNLYLHSTYRTSQQDVLVKTILFYSHFRQILRRM